MGTVSKSIEQIIVILFCLERRWHILRSIPPGRSCSLALPVYLIGVLQIMLQNFVRGACLAFVKDVPFFTSLSISELFIREDAALPVLPIVWWLAQRQSTYTYPMQCFYGLPETHLMKIHLWSLLQGVLRSRLTHDLVWKQLLLPRKHVTSVL